MSATTGMTKCQIQSTTQSALLLKETPCLSHVLSIIHVMLVSVQSGTEMLVMESHLIANILTTLKVINIVWYNLELGLQITMILFSAAFRPPFYLYTDSVTVTLVTINVKL